MSNPSTPEPTEDSTATGELQRRFGARWQIELGALRGVVGAAPVTR